MGQLFKRAVQKDHDSDRKKSSRPPVSRGWSVTEAPGAELLTDTNGTQIVPPRMGARVLLIGGQTIDGSFASASDGAERDMLRVADKRGLVGEGETAVITRKTARPAARHSPRRVDVSALPSACGPVAPARCQMAGFSLTDVGDGIRPSGPIMAGDLERDAPCRMRARPRFSCVASPA